jgi:hypothetical protein
MSCLAACCVKEPAALHVCNANLLTDLPRSVLLQLAAAAQCWRALLKPAYPQTASHANQGPLSCLFTFLSIHPQCAHLAIVASADEACSSTWWGPGDLQPQHHAVLAALLVQVSQNLRRRCDDRSIAQMTWARPMAATGRRLLPGVAGTG